LYKELIQPNRRIRDNVTTLKDEGKAMFPVLAKHAPIDAGEQKGSCAAAGARLPFLTG
jgi:hypothetical protein